MWKTLQRGGPVMVGETMVQPEQVMSAPRRGISIAYTGDTAHRDALAQAVGGVDLLICEATYGETEQEALAKEHGHMTFAQAAQLAKAAQAKALWLTHYSPMITDPQEYLKNAECCFSQAFCGEDGMTQTLRFDKKPNIREKSVI